MWGLRRRGEGAVMEPVCRGERGTSGAAAASSGAKGGGVQRGAPLQPFVPRSHPSPRRVA